MDLTDIIAEELNTSGSADTSKDRETVINLTTINKDIQSKSEEVLAVGLVDLGDVMVGGEERGEDIG